MNNEEHSKTLTDIILNAIRDYFQKEDTELNVTAITLSALTANIVAFINSEPTWTPEIKKDVSKRIYDEILKYVD